MLSKFAFSTYIPSTELKSVGS